jgi:hypothetical protein
LNTTLLFNHLELKEIPVTSCIGQDDPLSWVAFIISVLPDLIKIQMTGHLYPYIHKLELGDDNDTVFDDTRSTLQN